MYTLLLYGWSAAVCHASWVATVGGTAFDSLTQYGYACHWRLQNCNWIRLTRSRKSWKNNEQPSGRREEVGTVKCGRSPVHRVYKHYDKEARAYLTSRRILSAISGSVSQWHIFVSPKVNLEVTEGSVDPRILQIFSGSFAETNLQENACFLSCHWILCEWQALRIAELCSESKFSKISCVVAVERTTVAWIDGLETLSQLLALESRQSHGFDCTTTSSGPTWPLTIILLPPWMHEALE